MRIVSFSAFVFFVTFTFISTVANGYTITVNRKVGEYSIEPKEGLPSCALYCNGYSYSACSRSKGFIGNSTFEYDIDLNCMCREEATMECFMSEANPCYVAEASNAELYSFLEETEFIEEKKDFALDWYRSTCTRTEMDYSTLHPCVRECFKREFDDMLSCRNAINTRNCLCSAYDASIEAYNRRTAGAPVGHSLLNAIYRCYRKPACQKSLMYSRDDPSLADGNFFEHVCGNLKDPLPEEPVQYKALARVESQLKLSKNSALASQIPFGLGLETSNQAGNCSSLGNMILGLSLVVCISFLSNLILAGWPICSCLFRRLHAHKLEAQENGIAQAGVVDCEKVGVKKSVLPYVLPFSGLLISVPLLTVCAVLVARPTPQFPLLGFILLFFTFPFPWFMQPIFLNIFGERFKTPAVWDIVLSKLSGILSLPFLVGVLQRLLQDKEMPLALSDEDLYEADLDGWYNANYPHDLRLKRILTASSLLVIIFGCLGVLELGWLFWKRSMHWKFALASGLTSMVLFVAQTITWYMYAFYWVRHEILCFRGIVVICVILALIPVFTRILQHLGQAIFGDEVAGGIFIGRIRKPDEDKDAEGTPTTDQIQIREPLEKIEEVPEPQGSSEEHQIKVEEAKTPSAAPGV